MKRIEITELTKYEVRVVVVPLGVDTLEIKVHGESYRILNQKLGIAVNTRTGEHVTIEMEDSGIFSLAS